MTCVSDEADLDALIARIQSDLRSGRHPSQRPAPGRDTQIRLALRRIRGGPNRRAALLEHAARWLVPSMIVAVVAAGVLLFGTK
jgi:hypothetical protein